MTAVLELRPNFVREDAFGQVKRESEERIRFKLDNDMSYVTTVTRADRRLRFMRFLRAALGLLRKALDNRLDGAGCGRFTR